MKKFLIMVIRIIIAAVLITLASKSVTHASVLYGIGAWGSLLMIPISYVILKIFVPKRTKKRQPETAGDQKAVPKSSNVIFKSK